MQCLHRWCGFKHGNVRDIFRVFFYQDFPPPCMCQSSLCLLYSSPQLFHFYLSFFFIRAALIWRVQISAFACLLASLLGRDVLQGTIFRSIYRKKVASHLPTMVYTLQYQTMSDGNRNLLKNLLYNIFSMIHYAPIITDISSKMDYIIDIWFILVKIAWTFKFCHRFCIKRIYYFEWFSVW